MTTPQEIERIRQHVKGHQFLAQEKALTLLARIDELEQQVKILSSEIDQWEEFSKQRPS